MEIRVCDICKVRSQLPEGCISCSYAKERDQRIALEAHLLELLQLLRGITVQVDSAVQMVQSGQINPADLHRFSSAVKQLPEKVNEP